MRLRLTGLSLFMSLMLATIPIQGQDVTIMQDGRYYFERTAQTFAVTPGGTLTIDSPSGSIRIESGTNNEVVVVAEKRISENDEADAREEFSGIEVGRITGG